MAVTRTNILEDTNARDRYIEGVLRLKREIINPQQQLSTYDAFVIWHHRTMNIFTPPNQRGRNAAHAGPVFLPWHRYMLIALEQQLQRVLNDINFALPYWAWHQDGDRPVAQQRNSALFAANCMGGNGVASQQFQVTTGPFAFRPGDAQGWRVRVSGTSSGSMALVNRGLQRQLAEDVATLPTTAQARAWPFTMSRRGIRTRQTASGMWSRAGGQTAPACITGCTSGSAATWGCPAPPTTRCSTSTTPTSIGCGPHGSAGTRHRNIAPPHRQPPALPAIASATG
jgi:hypothetical protein